MCIFLIYQIYTNKVDITLYSKIRQNLRMSSSAHKVMIIEYWYRVLSGSSFSIVNISKIIIEYCKEYEQFDKDLTHQSLELDDEGLILCKDAHNAAGCISSFGKIIAKPGYKYHWKIETVESERYDGNIGIVEADQVIETNGLWWGTQYGWSYFTDQAVYHGTKHHIYGDSYITKGDIVDIWLDLKENEGLSFSKNNTKFAKAYDMDRDKSYRLAIGLFRGKVKIVSFEILD